MPLVLIDYTPFYYVSVTGTPAPPVTAGKFVQIRHKDTLFLVLSPKELTKYHANLIERFCMDKGIEGAYDPEGKRFDIFDRAWEILGGGKFERDENRKAIKLYDNSMAYGKFQTAGLRETLSSLPELSGYTVMIE